MRRGMYPRKRGGDDSLGADCASTGRTCYQTILDGRVAGRLGSMTLASIDNICDAFPLFYM